MIQTKGRLFAFSAPSGSGKTTLVQNLLRKIPNLVFSISATTRDRRRNETNGVDYFFLTEEEFKEKINRNEFVEWEKFYGYYYGTLKEFVNNIIESGKSVVLEVDVKGAIKIKESYPDSVLIFISPPDIEELKRRLAERNTETEKDFKKRIERAQMELSYKDKFDYLVINNNLESAKADVIKIVNKELIGDKNADCTN